MRLYRRLLVFLRPHTWRLVGNILFNVTAAALDGIAFTLLIPFLNTLFGMPNAIAQDMGWLTVAQDRLIGAFLVPDQPLASLRGVILVIIAMVALKNVFLWAGGQLGASLQEYLTRDLRAAVFAHMQRLPLGWFSRTKTGQIIARILTDTEQTKAILAEVATRTIQNAAQLLVTIWILYTMSPRLTLYALVVAPLIIGLLQPILRKLRKGHRRLRAEYGEITSVLQEVVSGIRLVKSFRGEAYEDGRFIGASGRYSKGMTRIQRIALLSGPLTEVLGTVVAVAILWLGAQEVLGGRGMDGGTLITFMVLVMRLLQPLKQLSQAPTIAQQSLAAAERLFDVLDQPTELQADRGTRDVRGLERELVFDAVGFAYGDEPVLRDVSFTARKGEVIALVGASGAGKSTLVDLIPRFIEPTSGRILLDGVDTREIKLPALRSLTGIVSQDTVLFNDTVRANIAYGAGEKYTQAQVEAAARAANAHEFIAALPEGYDTVLGERGTRLSGGQRQRLAIARALLTDPPILILDEATSALDTESERLVQEALDRLLAGRTTFVIAHRLSTIVHATQILVMDAGQVVERGTHDELLARGGAYARLHALQQRGERNGDG
ncbi:ABC transporter ATP-binding protein [Pseudogemmatithrix spongiicola]|uniref:ABC transporter ATP-binding protein n=1 Tax=Pseudogemmatithrix spongiicola TaxID=3062599 RepID=A0AA49JSJ8_9BACT|nr:ABC transporter ATP-binding protein [Gemmatimonadaceae bacterium 'strain 138']WKW14107.1 ABC transporter ATP-binding protein [Gemmatimonadaceae bacterium 'strain 318']